MGKIGEGDKEVHASSYETNKSQDEKYNIGTRVNDITIILYENRE